MAKKTESKEQTLEEVFAGIEEVIASMEAENVSLEDSFTLYHKGMEMLKIGSGKIDKIEKQMLILDKEGETHEF